MKPEVQLNLNKSFFIRRTLWWKSVRTHSVNRNASYTRDNFSSISSVNISYGFLKYKPQVNTVSID